MNGGRAGLRAISEPVHESLGGRRSRSVITGQHLVVRAAALPPPSSSGEVPEGAPFSISGPLPPISAPVKKSLDGRPSRSVTTAPHLVFRFERPRFRPPPPLSWA